MRRTLNWVKWRVKKNNLAPLALRIQNIRYQEFFCIPCSVFEDDETSTVKGWKGGSSIAYCKPCFWEVMEEYVKVECNDSKSGKNRGLQKQEERSSTKRKSITVLKYGIGPRLFSFSAYEIKLRIDTRYAAVWIGCRANVAFKSDLIQLGSAHEWSGVWTGPMITLSYLAQFHQLTMPGRVLKESAITAMLPDLHSRRNSV